MAAPVATEEVDQLLRMLCGYALQAGKISERHLQGELTDEARFDWERALDVFDGAYFGLAKMVNWSNDGVLEPRTQERRAIVAPKRRPPASKPNT